MTNPLIIALEIGGTKLQGAVGNPSGEILWQTRGRVDPKDGVPGILAWVDQHLPELEAKARELGTPTQHPPIAVGFGGPVDTENATVLVSHQIAGWEGINWRERYNRGEHRPVWLFNDSNAAGWGEYCLGAGRGATHFAYMNIGSGIGGALVIDGRLHNGQGLGAGELGHTYIPDWTASQPGVAAKTEDLCSGWAIENRLRACTDLPPDSPLLKLANGRPETLTCAILGKAAEEGDPQAQREVNQIASGVGTAITNLVTLFHPERIALGGGVPLMGEVLLDPIRQHVDQHVFGPYRNSCKIVPCELGEDVVLAGALCLAATELEKVSAR
jgi:glucokinase